MNGLITQDVYFFADSDKGIQKIIIYFCNEHTVYLGIVILMSTNLDTYLS